ncbi:MAG: UDP-N-acetylmuramate dehydrogenase [Actinomycetota bacterium]|nr:UDP-N-acetylmuramate dehydrogenase [Actinomycetota bacterium]
MTGPLLAEHTTLRLGGPTRDFVEVATERELIEAVARADDAGSEALLLAGGSNLVVSDDEFPGTVVHVRTTGLTHQQDARGGATVTVAAGESWDGLVARAVSQGWVGVEALSGIPGSVGASPIQNVGAYGQEVSETIAWVRCWDRVHKLVRTLASAECGFGYRTSRFKEDPDRFLVLTVTFAFALGDLGAPLRYGELARTLGVEAGHRAPLRQVRDAVLTLRAAKGMVLDAADHDTWSAGSFFTNPFLSRTQSQRLPEDAPRWEQPDGSTKASAAWLIERTGFAKGYGDGRVSLSTKHTLALTNRGDATTKDLLALASQVQSGVFEKFGIWLVNEPVLVGCSLPRP